MRLRGKLAFGVSSVAVAFLATFLFILWSQQQFGKLKELEIESVRMLAEWNGLLSASQLVLTQENSPQDALSKISDRISDLETSIAGFASDPRTEAIDQETLDQLEMISIVWNTLWADFETLERRLKDLAEMESEGTLPEESLVNHVIRTAYGTADAAGTAMLAVTDTVRIVTSLAGSSEELTQLFLSVADGVGIAAEQAAERNRLYSFGLVAAVTIFSIFFALTFSRRLASRVKSIEGALSNVAERDFTVRTKSRVQDEIGNLGRHVDTVLDQTSGVLSQVRGSAAEVSDLQGQVSRGSAAVSEALDEISGSVRSIRGVFERLFGNTEETAQAVEQIAGAIEALTNDLAEQSSAVEQSSASIEEISSSIQNVSRLTDDRRQGAEALMEVVRAGGAGVSETNEFIESLSDQIDTVLEAIEVIDNVAEQTNLLAMNAAIESAHAGDAGRGFAVVAEEIRKLSESTAENSGRIAASLKRIASQISDTKTAGRNSADTYERIITDVRSFADALEEISRSTTELAAGTQEVLVATNTVSDLTHRVKGNYASIDTLSGGIKERMTNVRSMTGEVNEQVKAINTGTEEIVTVMKDVDDLRGRSDNELQALVKLVGTFKTDVNGAG